MMWERFNLLRYFGLLCLYIAFSLSGAIDLTIEQYILFIIGAFLISLKKEVAE